MQALGFQLDSSGWTVLALQDGGNCRSSATAEDTYNRYEISDGCGDDGKGGPYANHVYKLVIKISKLQIK